jgi:transposase InsO family protein
VWCDLSTGFARPLVPAAWRPRVFAALHNIAHPGIRASRRLIAARYVWPGVAADVAEMCRACQDCRRGKVNSQVAAVKPIELPARQFSHIHVDLVGPLPPSKAGNMYVMTIIDRSTRWFEAVPLAATAAADCAQALFVHWISRYGVPDFVTSNRGPQFASEVWAAMCRRLGIIKKLTTAFHPQANGLVERLHRQLKEALRARQAGVNWEEHLPWVLLGLRVAPKEDSGVSAAQLTFGIQLTLPGDLLGASPAAAEELASKLRADAAVFVPLPLRQRSYAEVAAELPAQLQRAEYVYIRRGGTLPPLACKYEGPYKVLQRAEKYFIVQIGGKQDSVSVDRLKPYAALGEVSPAAPPRRGRPPIVAAPAAQ